MKCKKLTYISPLHGSVQCGELINEDYGCIEFGADSVFSLHERTCAIAQFLDNQVEDLVGHVPEELKSLILKAIFGNYKIIDDSVFLSTEIYVKQELSESQYDVLAKWITGQLSDGWGEGIEQEEVWAETLTVETLEFDESTCNFEHGSYNTQTYYYVKPWASKDWCLELADTEEVELDIFCQEPIVHSSYCKLNDDRTYTTRTVYQAADKHSAIQLIQNSGHIYSSELITLIEEQGWLGSKVSCYVVHESVGLFNRFLPIVGFVNEDTDLARLFEIYSESGDIDLQDFPDGKHKGFYQKLLTK